MMHSFTNDFILKSAVITADFKERFITRLLFSLISYLHVNNALAA